MRHFFTLGPVAVSTGRNIYRPVVDVAAAIVVGARAALVFPCALVPVATPLFGIRCASDTAAVAPLYTERELPVALALSCSVVLFLLF